MPASGPPRLWRLCKKRAIIAGMKTSDRNPAAILRSLKKYTQPVTGALQAEAGNHKEFTIDELAREAGSTVRNVRAYQDRNILPPPEKRGRTGIYTDVHLARLLEDTANGRTEMVQEVRTEIRVLSRTLAAIAEKAGR